MVSLDLSANSVGDAGSALLAESLRGNDVLLALSLRGNPVGDVGAARLAESLDRFALPFEEVVKRRRKRNELVRKLKEAIAAVAKGKVVGDDGKGKGKTKAAAAEKSKSELKEKRRSRSRRGDLREDKEKNKKHGTDEKRREQKQRNESRQKPKQSFQFHSISFAMPLSREFCSRGN